MTVSKIIGNQTGVQYQGVQDYSETDTSPALVNALFTGSFRHGDFNKPFKVTKTDYRAKLGYDPENLDFIAVEDALNSGASYIWVMRVDKKKNNGGTEISCVGATYSVELGFPLEASKMEKYQIKIDGIIVLTGTIPLDYRINDVGILYSSSGGLKFVNNSVMENKRIEVACIDTGDSKYLFRPKDEMNQTLLFEDEKEGLYSKVSFCLSGDQPS